MSFRVPVPVLILAMVVLVGCGDATGTEDAARFAVWAEGDRQGGFRGRALRDSVVVRLEYGDGSPAAGVEVEWRPLSAGASVGASRTATDASGRAANAWSLGAETGEQRLEVRSAADGTVLDTLVADAWPGVARVDFDPPASGLEVGETVRFSATVLDSLGAAIPDLPFEWFVSPASAGAEPGAATIDEEGNLTGHRAAEAVWVGVDALGLRRALPVPVYDVAIRLEERELDLVVGASTTISARIEEALGRQGMLVLDPEFRALDPALLEVAGAGVGGSAASRTRRLTAKAPGETRLVVRTGMAADTIPVRVTAP